MKIPFIVHHDSIPMIFPFLRKKHVKKNSIVCGFPMKKTDVFPEKTNFLLRSPGGHSGCSDLVQCRRCLGATLPAGAASKVSRCRQAASKGNDFSEIHREVTIFGS